MGIKKGNWLREQVGKVNSKFLKVGVDECMAWLWGGDKRTQSTVQMKEGLTSRLDSVRRILRSHSPPSSHQETEGLSSSKMALGHGWELVDQSAGGCRLGLG